VLRLTLRTLLAYLDDTLEPAQAKDIGQKVAESEFAQETVERIKKVTRRRRLTVPPVLPDDHTLDPNTIAEYLDNVLPAEQVAELEQGALDNDVRLAEVAACHQILTLVLGEPAKVPPTARKRMYRLVQGPEALPFRPATRAAAPVAGVAAPEAVDEYHEDDLLASVLGPRSALWVLSLLLVIALLVVAVWRAVPQSPPSPRQGYVAVAAAGPGPEAPSAVTPKVPAPVTTKSPDVPDVPVNPDLPPIEAAPPPRVVGEPAPGEIKAPDSERRVIATYDTPTQPLLYRRRETPRWDKADPTEGRMSTTDTLLALPGFHPELLLENGVRLQLWGNAPDLLAVPVSESRVTLYVPSQGADADLTLHSGRILLTASPKAMRPVVVRVRFLDQKWDVTLADADTEVAIDLIGQPSKGPVLDRDMPESPRFLAYLGVVQGTARVRSEFETSGDMTGGAKWKWDSKGGRPGPAPKDDKDDPAGMNRFTKAAPATPAAKEMGAAVAEMVRRVGFGQGPFDVDFDATIKEPREAVSRRVLSAWMLAAVDSIGYLIDALEADGAAPRDAAARALQHWCAQDPSREGDLKQVLATKALFSDRERDLVSALVAGSPPPESADKLFELLRDAKLAVRELARLHLAKVDAAGAKESRYDAASDQRTMQAATWERLWAKRIKGKAGGG